MKGLTNSSNCWALEAHNPRHMDWDQQHKYVTSMRHVYVPCEQRTKDERAGQKEKLTKSKPMHKKENNLCD